MAPSATSARVREQFACGPYPQRHLNIARRFAGAGFDHLVAMNAGLDLDGFMDFARELAAPLRALTPGRRMTIAANPATAARQQARDAERRTWEDSSAAIPRPG